MTMQSNRANMTFTPMPRAKTLAVRLQPDQWKLLEAIKAHYSEKYPGVEMTDSAAIKIMMAFVARTELAPPAPEPSSARPKTTTRSKR